MPAPRPRGQDAQQGHLSLPRVPLVSTARMLAGLPALVLVFPSRKAGATEAGRAGK